MERLWSYGDVFVINVSSPNTPNLRELQDDEGLTRILHHCLTVNAQQAAYLDAKPKPILVKVAPDMTGEQLVHIAKTAKENGADGIVLSNTTVDRPESPHPRDVSVFDQQGGMSGQPLKERSTAMIRTVRQAIGDGWPIIGAVSYTHLTLPTTVIV